MPLRPRGDHVADVLFPPREIAGEVGAVTSRRVGILRMPETRRDVHRAGDGGIGRNVLVIWRRGTVLVPAVRLAGAAIPAAEHLHDQVEARGVVGGLPAVDDGARRVVGVVDEEHRPSVDPEVAWVPAVPAADVLEVAPDLGLGGVSGALPFVVEGDAEARIDRGRVREQRRDARLLRLLTLAPPGG